MIDVQLKCNTFTKPRK